ncbi:MAG: hypothetical protein HKP59_09085 [Lutibacter sp.]|uniref:hypothetical protein n=1 Tax=Lutibacter sp. TaxID=1925666 RepID=UPI001839741B|nr:hypothetical protein [Lutibacter sp.]MBT8317771.1 hypothetical protein [Lutibacter sp.]NNJ58629.1 hypothetical protein [Lutibacter sp.]
MKKIILVSILFVITISTVNAQEISNHAIGIRFGDNDGFGGEISYQRQLSQNNRFEVDLGYRDHDNFNAFKLSGIYQWVWNIDGGFNWYAGFGAGIGSWKVGNGYDGNGDDGLFLNADGNIGIEYNFDIPLLISLDFRPEFGIVGDYGKDTDLDLALSIRYQFN